MNDVHMVQGVSVKGRVLHMVVDDVPYEIDLSEQTQRLHDASEVQLTNVEVSPSGYGLHWPDIDEDLSVDGMIGIIHEAPLAVAESHPRYGGEEMNAAVSRVRRRAAGESITPDQVEAAIAESREERGLCR